MIIPTTIKIKVNKTISKPLKLLLKELIASGIKSNIEIHIITAEAKEQADEIILFLFLIFTKIGIAPIIVASPANVVKIKGYNIKSPN